MVINKMRRSVRGATSIEYALVASLIAVAAVGAFASLGGEVKAKYTGIAAKV